MLNLYGDRAFYTIAMPALLVSTLLSLPGCGDICAGLCPSPSGSLSGNASPLNTLPSPTYVVSTLAGNGTHGFADGNSTNAQFNLPAGAALDASGNVYIGDYLNHRIRKIDTQGTVTTLAGSTVGFTNAIGASAQFNLPAGVAVDSSGNVYVADSGNHRIRAITSGGTVSALAGNGIAGFTDGNSASAQFHSPLGVAVDSSGNVYVADSGNHRIRTITSGGTVSTLAGNGTSGFVEGNGTSAQFNNPQGLAVDSSGNIYVADSGNHRIRKITSAGNVTTLAGNGSAGFADGNGTSAQFNNPEGVAVDPNGNLYVSEFDGCRIRKITSIGGVTTVAGNGICVVVDGQGLAAGLDKPWGIAVDSSGYLFVADHYGQRIRKITH